MLCFWRIALLCAEGVADGGLVGLCPVWDGRLALHVAHLAVDALDTVVVDEEVGDGAELWRLGRQRRLEHGGELEEVLGERH